MYKGGVDVLHSRFQGTSASGPVLIRRTNGTLARLLDFGPASTRQVVNSTDVARVRAGSRATGVTVLCGNRRSTGSRRRGRPLEHDPARRSRLAAEQRGHIGAAQRLRRVLRADAVGGRGVQSVRSPARDALCGRRHHPAWTAVALHARDGARPADVAQLSPGTSPSITGSIRAGRCTPA